jgi:NADPH-dependent 2,4-dienoyl-CoA reductase/sulfur reductase-like enzyme/rhodanese-related sulfurtransferase/two-component sensor histidine kinase
LIVRIQYHLLGGNPIMSGSDTRLEALEKQLETCRVEIQHLLKERSEYLRVSAHQMKSPLATIIFSIETLLGDYAGRLNSKQMRVVESIKRSTNELQNLIMDILELEKYRSGLMVPETIDVSELCRNVIEELRDKIQEKNIQFESEIPRKSIITQGSGVGLRHAIYNLIENAIKYSQRDGGVRVSVDYETREKKITLIVEDHGIGIPTDEQEHIFEEFYRAPNARLFDNRGTGFGLAIVKQILENSGGEISLWSRENEGTRVTLHLPLQELRELSFTAEATKAKRIVVIGGVAAGPKAASRARRIDSSAKITVFEKENFLAYAGCALPYYIAGRLKNQRDLFVKHAQFAGETEFFREVKGIEIKNLCEVISIDRENKLVNCREVLTDRLFSEPYDTLILATGSRPDIPQVKGVELQGIFVLHGVTDSERIKRELAGGAARDIIILGGGKIGVETAEAFTESGGRITIIEREQEILPFLDVEMAALVRKHLERRGVKIVTGETVKEFIGKERVEHVLLDHSGTMIPTDLVILATGFRPNVELARTAGLEIGPSGAITVNEQLMTSDKSIYAAGDCIELLHAVSGKPINLPLGSLATRQGRVAGTNAAGGAQRFGPITGTTVISVFDYNFAKTGLSEREASDAGFDPVSSYLPDYDRDPFMREARTINIKLTADRATRRILGVQGVGEGDVAKRIDVAAAVTAQGGTIEDVISLDLGYTPSFSQAIDNIISAAHVLQNKLDGVFEGISPFNAKEVLKTRSGCTCIDVRTPQDFEEQRIPGFESIPLESLRRRIDEIPEERSVLIVCETGARSYEAALILKAKGFQKVRILEGGLKMWPYEMVRE